MSNSFEGFGPLTKMDDIIGDMERQGQVMIDLVQGGCDVSNSTVAHLSDHHETMVKELRGVFTALHAARKQQS
ncbi:MAG: hypothetical protein RIM72_22325 [Alphaproteobacteria bacterium]